MSTDLAGGVGGFDDGARVLAYGGDYLHLLLGEPVGVDASSLVPLLVGLLGGDGPSEALLGEDAGFAEEVVARFGRCALFVVVLFWSCCFFVLSACRFFPSFGFFSVARDAFLFVVLSVCAR